MWDHKNLRGEYYIPKDNRKERYENLVFIEKTIGWGLGV